jgi:hypothetical protein
MLFQHDVIKEKEFLARMRSGVGWRMSRRGSSPTLTPTVIKGHGLRVQQKMKSSTEKEAHFQRN